MPNPTTLTVKVNPAIGEAKTAYALRIALPKAGIGHEHLGVIEVKSTTGIPWAQLLNPNVLDPEDTDLCCRVLGAVVHKTLYSPVMYFKWHDGFLCACTKDGVLLGSKGMPTAVREGFELHSIPSLGLTRRPLHPVQHTQTLTPTTMPETLSEPIADPNAPRSIPWSEHLESALYHIPVDALPLVADALEGVFDEAGKTENAAGQAFFEELATIAKRVRANRIS